MTFELSKNPGCHYLSRIIFWHPRIHTTIPWTFQGQGHWQAQRYSEVRELVQKRGDLNQISPAWLEWRKGRRYWNVTGLTFRKSFFNRFFDFIKINLCFSKCDGLTSSAFFLVIWRVSRDFISSLRRLFHYPPSHCNHHQTQPPPPTHNADVRLGFLKSWIYVRSQLPARHCGIMSHNPLFSMIKLKCLV